MLKWLADKVAARLDRSSRPLLAAIFLLTLVPVLFIAVGSYVRTSRDLTYSVLSRRQALAYLAAATLKANLDRLMDLGVSLASRVQFRTLVQGRRWDEAIEIMKHVPIDFPYVERIFVVHPNGTLMADTPSLPNVRGRDFSFRDWYRGVSEHWEPYLSDAYRRTAEPPYNVFAAAFPVKTDQGGVLGILVVQVRLSSLMEWVRSIDAGPSGDLAFVDRMGQVAARSGADLDTVIVGHSNLEAARRALRGERGVELFAADAGGERRLAAYEPVPGYGWGVIVEQPARSAFAARDGSLRRMAVAYSLLVLLNLGVTYVLVRMMLERARVQTRIKQLNEDLKRRAAELDATNKELEAFSYSVSHDLRAPLRSIAGFSEVLMRDFADRLDGASRDYFERICKATVRMGQLIDELLGLSRVTRAQLRRDVVDLSSIAREIANELREREPLRRVEWRIAEKAVADGDRKLLRIAMENLLGNAWKFTGKRANARVEFGIDGTAGEKAFFVRDDGAGFDMAYADKLFGAFQRLHGQAEFPGTGIGLATVQRIVHRHGGRVWAVGALGEGATVYFTLAEGVGGHG